MPLGEYPEPLVDLLKNEATVQDLVVKAILNKSRDYAVQALMAVEYTYVWSVGK